MSRLTHRLSVISEILISHMLRLALKEAKSLGRYRNEHLLFWVVNLILYWINANQFTPSRGILFGDGLRIMTYLQELNRTLPSSVGESIASASINKPGSLCSVHNFANTITAQTITVKITSPLRKWLLSHPPFQNDPLPYFAICLSETFWIERPDRSRAGYGLPALHQYRESARMPRKRLFQVRPYNNTVFRHLSENNGAGKQFTQEKA